LDAANEFGKAAGIQTASVAEAKQRLAQGFRFVAVSSDARLLYGALRDAVRQLRGEG
jgi:2-keto-3-deoxy-L-rhamnonate aldolase RhmA